MTRPPKRTWVIEGYDSTRRILFEEVAEWHLSEGRIKLLLQMLAARHLSEKELVGALSRRGTRSANNFLEVQRNHPHPVFSCGENPFYTARPSGYDPEKARQWLDDFDLVQ